MNADEHDDHDKSCWAHFSFSAIPSFPAHFLSNYKTHGFKDKSSMLRAALDHFMKEMELESLRKSADLYSEIYSKDENLKELTEIAVTGWPG